MPQCCVVPPMATSASTNDPSADSTRSHESDMLGNSCTARVHIAMAARWGVSGPVIATNQQRFYLHDEQPAIGLAH